MSSRRAGIVIAVFVASAASRRTDAAQTVEQDAKQQPAGEQACLAAFRTAEMHVQAGRLRAAQRQLLSCAQPTCGKFLRRQCASRFTELQPAVSSVEAECRPEPSAPAAAAPAPQPKRLNLAAIEPATDAAPAEETDNVVSKSADSPAPDRGSAARRPRLPFVLGGTGLAAIGAGVLLTEWGRADNARLTACTPACANGAVSHVRLLYVGADSAFALGTAALVGAAWMYLHRRSPDAEPTREAALRLDVHPTRAGAVAAVRGTF